MLKIDTKSARCKLCNFVCYVTECKTIGFRIFLSERKLPRDKIVQWGIVHVLLAVALICSHLAQKRAMKLLHLSKYEM
jgi:hypothetical protein